MPARPSVPQSPPALRQRPGGAGGQGGNSDRLPGELRADIMRAYQERGGVEWLRRLDGRAFIGLLARLLPREAATTKEEPAPARTQPVALELIRDLVAQTGSGRTDALSSLPGSPGKFTIRRSRSGNAVGVSDRKCDFAELERRPGRGGVRQFVTLPQRSRLATPLPAPRLLGTQVPCTVSWHC